MTPRLASAPCTWGVWERTVDRDDLIPPELMLETVHGLGYTGIELGPPGYFGSDPAAVAAMLEPYGLELVGAFAPLRIADEDGFRERPRRSSIGRSRSWPRPARAGRSCSPRTRTRMRLAVAGRPEARARRRSDGDDCRRAAERVERAARARPDAASPRRSIRTPRPTSRAPTRSRRCSKRPTRPS